MTVSSLRIRWLAVLAVLAIAVVLSACNDSPAPTPEPTAPTATPTTAPTATPIDTPTPGTAADGGSVASDRAALVALYNATEGASWDTSTNWLSDRPLDEWHGVTTNSVGRVTELSLSSNQLTGPIPAELGDLTNLVSLDLDANQLTGPIPAELGDLSNLESLDLDANELTGCVPAGVRDIASISNDVGDLGLPDCG